MPPASQFSLVSQEGKGKIDINDLREACIAFNLPIDVWLLEQVFDYCDADRDGQINYIEFANFLNWKEKLPSGFADVPCEFFFLMCVLLCHCRQSLHFALGVWAEKMLDVSHKIIDQGKSYQCKWRTSSKGEFHWYTSNFSNHGQ